jgi:predicted AlkP superfamily phosphohydrolase/phosphomutase
VERYSEIRSRDSTRGFARSCFNLTRPRQGITTASTKKIKQMSQGMSDEITFTRGNQLIVAIRFCRGANESLRDDASRDRLVAHPLQ